MLVDQSKRSTAKIIIGIATCYMDGAIPIVRSGMVCSAPLSAFHCRLWCLSQDVFSSFSTWNIYHWNNNIDRCLCITDPCKAACQISISVHGFVMIFIHIPIIGYISLYPIIMDPEWPGSVSLRKSRWVQQKYTNGGSFFALFPT